MSKPQNKWPFDQWHQIAIRRFNLSPSEFWTMPLRDWLRLMNGLKRPGIDRAALNGLLKTYPDAGDKNE